MFVGKGRDTIDDSYLEIEHPSMIINPLSASSIVQTPATHARTQSAAYSSTYSPRINQTLLGLGTAGGNSPRPITKYGKKMNITTIPNSQLLEYHLNQVREKNQNEKNIIISTRKQEKKLLDNITANVIYIYIYIYIS